MHGLPKDNGRRFKFVCMVHFFKISVVSYLTFSSLYYFTTQLMKTKDISFLSAPFCKAMIVRKCLVFMVHFQLSIEEATHCQLRLMINPYHCVYSLQ